MEKCIGPVTETLLNKCIKEINKKKTKRKDNERCYRSFIERFN